MRAIGLHVRSQGSLAHVLDKVIAYNLSLFQCFFIHGRHGRRMYISNSDAQRFRTYRDRYCQQLYVHGSYWINLADTKRTMHPALEYEISIAKRLGFTHMVLHPGAIHPQEDKRHGINALAQSLNRIMHMEKDIIIVLENTAHGNRSIGSDIKDFALLLEQLKFPERLQFCIDTAHAFAYGYDITSDTGLQWFINTIDACIGIENIALLHVNDSMADCGSRIDRHAIINQGHIKEEALKKFVLHERLAHIPLILELPVITDQEELAILNTVYTWHK